MTPLKDFRLSQQQRTVAAVVMAVAGMAVVVMAVAGMAVAGVTNLEYPLILKNLSQVMILNLKILGLILGLLLDLIIDLIIGLIPHALMLMASETKRCEQRSGRSTDCVTSWNRDRAAGHPGRTTGAGPRTRGA